MIRRSALVFAALALVATACAYESSGTTTTTTVDVADLPPSTGPADVVVDDQRIEGTTVEIASVTLPSDGWVVVREDVAGSPGEIIGISEILRQGVVARVPIPFFIPITEDTIVHASIHVDMDRDGIFTYEPPDSLVDEIATFANGSIASATATIELLPPLEPAEALVVEQRTDGTVVTDASAVLPAPGFLVLSADDSGAAGEVLAVTELLEAGEYEGIEFTPSPALREQGLVWVTVWIDRDEDGLFDPQFDARGVRLDGSIAEESALMQVVPVEPTSITATDQEGDGAAVVIAELVLPAPGFVEVLLDVDGAPGERLAVSGARVEGTYEDVSIELADALTDETVLWVRVIIDFDEDGVPSDGDRLGLVAVDGDTAQATFTFTIAEG
jgi:hypothetical protein